MPPFTWRNSFCLRVYFICYSHRHSSSHRVVVCVIYLFHPFLSLFASHVSCRQRAYAGTPWSYRCARRRNKASPTNFCFLVPLVARTCTAAPGRKTAEQTRHLFWVSSGWCISEGVLRQCRQEGKGRTERCTALSAPSKPPTVPQSGGFPQNRLLTSNWPDVQLVPWLQEVRTWGV